MSVVNKIEDVIVPIANEPLRTVHGKWYCMYESTTKVNKFMYCLPEPTVKSYKPLPTLNYVSVPPGAGKTHWAEKRIIDNSYNKDKIMMYVAPTKALINQVFDSLRSGHKKNFNEKRRIHRVYSDDHFDDGIRETQSVESRVAAIMPLLQRGDCVMITHAAFFSETRFTRKSEIELIFDEAGDSIVKEVPLELSGDDDERYFTRLISFELFPLEQLDDTDKINLTTDCSSFFRARICDSKVNLAEEYLDKPDSERNKRFESLLKQIMNKRYSVFVIRKSDNRYVFFNFVSPELAFDGYGSVILMSAFFEKSDMFHILMKNYRLKNISEQVNSKRVEQIFSGYEKRIRLIPLLAMDKNLSKNFIQHYYIMNPKYKDKFQDFLEENLHSLADKLYVRYKRHAAVSRICNSFMNKRSLFNLESIDPKLGKKIETIVKSVDKPIVASPIKFIQTRSLKVIEKLERKKLISKKPLLITNNIIKFGPEFERISPKSHGLNTYKEHNCILFAGAFNPTPNMIRFYNFYIPSYDFKTHWVGMTAVQGITRSNIRVVDSKSLVYVIVPTTKTCEVISETLGVDLKIMKEFEPHPDTTIGLLNEKAPLMYEAKREKIQRKRKSEMMAEQKRKIAARGGAVRFEDFYRKNADYRKLEGLLVSIGRKIKTITKNTIIGDTPPKELDKLLKEKLKTMEKIKAMRTKMRSELEGKK